MTLWCCCAICIPLCREFSALIIVFSRKITMSIVHIYQNLSSISASSILSSLFFIAKMKMYLQPVCVCACVRTFPKQRLSYFGNWKWKLKLYKPYNLFGISCLFAFAIALIWLFIYLFIADFIWLVSSEWSQRWGGEMSLHTARTLRRSRPGGRVHCAFKWYAVPTAQWSCGNNHW